MNDEPIKKIGKNTNLFINITGSAIIFLIVLFGVLRSNKTIDSHNYNAIRAAAVLILFIFWMLMTDRRVVSKLVKRYLLLIAGLEMLWVLLRFIKYEFVKDGDGARYLWYLYYIPITMIPAMCLLLAVSVGKPDSYKQRRFLWLFPAASMILFTLVITNDLHSLVFIIPPGPDGLDVGIYKYGAVFTIIMSYAGACVLASFGIIFTKCRVPGSRRIKLLPLIPIMICAAGNLFYAFGVESFFGFYKIDITIFVCVLVSIALEMCIQCRLIPTNNGYEELFESASIRCVITDENFSPVIASDSYEEISDLRQAENAPVILNNGFRLSCASIKRGKVLWQDDLSELNTVLSELSATYDYLEGKNAAVRQIYEYQKKERRLIEKNRLYDRILSQTKPEIELYAELTEKLAEETDPAREKLLAVKIAFVSGFIKRRDNLVFLSEEEMPIDPSELLYCIQELLSTLELCGVSCSCSNTLERPIGFERISALFESFYRIIYGLTDKLSAVCVYLNEADGEAQITMRITFSEGTLPPIIGTNINVEREDGEWTVTICG